MSVRKPFVRRAIVIGCALLLFGAYVLYSSSFNRKRRFRSTKATAILDDVRIIDGAADTWNKQQALTTSAMPAEEKSGISTDTSQNRHNAETENHKEAPATAKAVIAPATYPQE